MGSGQVDRVPGAQSGGDTKGRGKTLPAGKYHLRNLRFLGDFMTALGLTTTTAAQRAGFTQVTVYYWLKKDNARLSSVERLINAWGYSLSFELVPPEDPESIVCIEMPDQKRLSFLERAIAGTDRADLQKRIGVGTTTIYYWLSHDDIFISHIFNVAEAIGRKVKVTIRPANKNIT